MKKLSLLFLCLALFGAACGKQQTTSTSSGTFTLTTSELAQHASSKDCWILISEKVYDVTEFLSQHPGGIGEITPYCGRDASQAFATQGGRGQHSGEAMNDLSRYVLGPLNATITR